MPKTLTLEIYTENPYLENAHLKIDYNFDTRDELGEKIHVDCCNFRQQLINYYRTGFLKKIPTLKANVTKSSLSIDIQKAITETVEKTHFSSLFNFMDFKNDFKLLDKDYNSFPEPFLDYKALLERQRQNDALMKNFKKSKEPLQNILKRSKLKP